MINQFTICRIFLVRKVIIWTYGRSGVAESELHRFLKRVAAEKLEKKGFSIYLEPEWPPIDLLEWQRYRPDIFGIRRRDRLDEYAFVECETNPNSKRILAKNVSSIVIQTRLLKDTKSRKILAIPRTKVAALDPSVMKLWEVWAIEGPAWFQQT